MSGDRLGLKFPDICLMGEEKPQKNLTQETCPDRESNPGPLRERRIRYPLLHNGIYCTILYSLHVVGRGIWWKILIYFIYPLNAVHFMLRVLKAI